MKGFMHRKYRIRLQLREEERRQGDGDLRRWPPPAAENRTSVFTCVSSWFVVLLLLFFCMKGAPPSASAVGRADLYANTTSGTGRHIIIALIFLIAGPLMIRRWWPKLSLSLFSSSAVLLPILVALSTLWSYDPLDTLAKSFIIAFDFSFAGYLVYRYRSDELIKLLQLTNRLAVGLSLLFVIAAPSYGRGYNNEWRGIFAHKNDLGTFIIFLAIAEVVGSKRLPMERLLRRVFLLLDVLLCVMSQSRTAWLLAAAGLGVYFIVLLIMRFRSFERPLLVCGAFCSSAFLIGSVLMYRVELARMIGKDPTFSGRTKIWHAVLQAIAVHPMTGYGYGAFWRDFHGPSVFIMEQIGFTVAQSHQGYLEILLQLGFPGLIATIVVTAIACRKVLRLLHRQPSPIALWCGGVLMFTVMINFAEAFLLFQNEITTLLFFTACIALDKRSSALGYAVRSPKRLLPPARVEVAMS
jgi:exopolysaccharide production protein ExoQ